jgi:hypothetical protein
MANEPLVSVYIALARISADVAASLADELKHIAVIEERAGGEGQVNSSAFQHSDQKANQLASTLVSVVKTLNEIRAIGAGRQIGL